jgi:hypothetical protein
VSYLLSGQPPSRTCGYQSLFIPPWPRGANITHGGMRERWNLAGSTSLLSSSWSTLLNQFQHGLLGLVCLLESSHTGGLQDIVLSHVRDRLADVSILNAVSRTL